MTNAEILLRTILGPVRSDLRPLVFAVDIAANLLFSQHFSMDDILVTKHIYPDVARRIQRKPETASKRIERLSHACWDSLEEQNLISFYFGRDLRQSPAPGVLIVYLAVYAHLNIPFFTVIEQHPNFLFQSPPDSATVKALLRDRPLSVSQVMVFPDSCGYPVCPNCRITLERDYQNFCDRCGQRLSWKRYKKADIIYPDRCIPIHT